MSEYTRALSDLVSMQRRFEEQIARSKREVGAERERREAQIESAAEEHEAVVSRLEAVLVEARAQGLDFQPGAAPTDEHPDAPLADPVEYARQLIGRLEEALANFSYTRDALAAEEGKLSEAQRRQAAEERQRREREELRREEQWEKARQGTTGLVVALIGASAVGMAVGLTGSPPVLVLPVLVAGACFALVTSVVSTLPALAARRASGSMPPLPAVPPREERMAAAGYAAAGVALCSLGMALTSLSSGSDGALPSGALFLTVCGIAGVISVWTLLPLRE